MNSVEFDLFLHAEPRRRSVLVYREFRMAALVAVSAVRLDRVSAMGRAAGVGGGARKAGGQPGTPLRIIARQARRSAASSGHLLWSRPNKVSRALPTERSYTSGAGRRAVACACACAFTCTCACSVPVPCYPTFNQAICKDPIRFADTQSLMHSRPLPRPRPNRLRLSHASPSPPHARRPPSRARLVNGVDVGTGAGDTGGVSLFVNGGDHGNQKSDFAIAEVVVWPRGLTDVEMRGVSEHLMNRLD